MIACFILSIIVNARAGADIFNVATFWITTYFSLTMVTHIICSGKSHVHIILSNDGLSVHTEPGAIAWRISTTGRSYGSMKVFSPIVFVIVESSALYTLGVVTVLATLLSGSNGHYPAVNAIVPLVVSLCTFRLYLCLTLIRSARLLLHKGIVFSLIMLRIRFHVSALAGQSSDNQLWDNTASTRTGVWTASDGDPESYAIDFGGTRVKPDPYTRASE